MPSILDYSRAPDNPILPPGQIAEPDETVPYSERVKGAVDRHIATGGTLVDLARGIGRLVHPSTPVGIGQAIGTDLAERPGEFPSLFSAAERQTRLVDNAFAQDRAREEAYDRRIKAVKDATGIELPNPERGGYQLNERELRALTRDGPIDPAAYRRQRFEQDLAAARVDHPDNPEMRFGDIDAEARAIAQSAEHDYDAARKDTGLSTASSLAMAIGGNMWGQRRDPFAVGSLFAGPTSAVGKSVAARIASSGLFQGLYNAGVAALEQPAVQAWRSELGLRSGLALAAENVGLAFLFGAIPGAVFRGVHEIPAALRPSVKRVLAGAPEAGDIEKAMAAARSALGEIDAEMQPAARRAIKLGEDIDETARATAPARGKDVPPELHDDLEAAAARHAEDPVNQPSPAAVAVVQSLQNDPKWRPGKFDEDRAWRHIRDLFPEMSEEDMARVAARVEDLTKEPAPALPERPSGLRLFETEVSQEEGYTERAITYRGRDEAGKDRVQASFTIDGNTATLNDINAIDVRGNVIPNDQARNVIGPAEIRSLLGQFRELNPEVKRITADRVSGARTGGKYDVTRGQEMSVELRDRIAAARPQTEREAQMAASEAIEDIGNRAMVERTRATLKEPVLPEPEPLPEGVKSPKPIKDEPLDQIPWIDAKGRPDTISPGQLARVDRVEMELHDLIMSCK